MRNTKLFDLLEPRIGQEAAKIAVLNRYINVTLAIMAIGDVILFRAVSVDMVWLAYLAIALTLMVLAFGVYTKVRVARTLAKSLKVNISWYSVPEVMPLERFDIWLKKMKAESKR